MRTGKAKALLALLVLSVAAATLGACNTMAGLGQDMSAAGHALTNAASDTKTKNP